MGNEKLSMKLCFRGRCSVARHHLPHNMVSAGCKKSAVADTQIVVHGVDHHTPPHPNQTSRHQSQLLGIWSFLNWSLVICKIADRETPFPCWRPEKYGKRACGMTFFNIAIFGTKNQNQNFQFGYPREQSKILIF